MKIKNLVVITLIIAGISFALFGLVKSDVTTPIKTAGYQEDALRFTDTTAQFFLSGEKNIAITISDSTLIGTDTVFAFIKTGNLGIITGLARSSQIAVHNLAETTTTTNVDRMIPGDGLTRTYIYESIFPIYELWLVRSNKSSNNAYAPVTRVIVGSW